VRGKGEFLFADRSIEALVVVVKVVGFEFDVYLAPADRAPIAVTQPERLVTFVAKRLGFARAQEPIDLSKPAASAKECVLRFELGMLTGDTALLEDAVHWPSLQEADAARTGDRVSAETFRAAMLVRWKSLGGREQRPKADAVVRTAAEKATEEAGENGEGSEDVVVVRMGPPLDGPRTKAKSFDGQWKVVDRLEPDGR